MGWFLLVVIVAVLAFPAFLENRRQPINAKSRQNAAGASAALSQGTTYFRWIGPVRGPVAVMIHGLSTPSVVFDDLAAGLSQLGYRVLVYDLYGRGLSDAPKGAQDRVFFLRQLYDLLEYLELEEDITVIGYSMGGSVATAFAAEQPHRVKRVILLATAGVRTNEGGFSRFCRRVPVLGDWLYLGVGAIRMRRMLNQGAEASGVVLAAQNAELNRRGFLQAVLASRRGMLDATLEQEHRKIGRDGVPVVAIWGVQDNVVPLSAMGQLAQWNRAARQDEVAGAGHGLPFTHSAEVVEILRHVFRED